MPNLAERLARPGAFSHPVHKFQVIETHLSWVLLTGAFAYKIKKPVAFDFVDFSTRERRRFFCEEELRLNRAFAPELYLDVLPIVLDPDGNPAIGTAAEADAAIDWAVQMIDLSCRCAAAML